MNKFKLIKTLMKRLNIDYYKYYPENNTLVIFEPLPMSVFMAIRKILNDTYIDIIEKGNKYE